MAFVPYIEEGGIILPSWSYAYRSRQALPYSDPLPYERFVRLESQCVARYTSWEKQYPKVGNLYEPAVRSVSAWVKAFHYGNDSNGNLSHEFKNLRVSAHNRALNKLADKLSYVSNLFEAWYERKEVYTLLGQCLRSMRNLLQNWKKPKFWKNLWANTGKTVKKPETLPEAWLLLQFAIKPLVGTIDDCINLLLDDFPLTWEDASSGSDFPISKWNAGADYEFYIESTMYIVKHGARYTALNPNAQLANIMGLTTPVSTFADVIPWVWAVNYFVNVNEVISNFEVRFPGVIIDKSYTSVISKSNHFGQMLLSSSPFKLQANGRDGEPATEPYVKMRGTSVLFLRTVSSSVPTYKLERKFPALGTEQFANLTSAIALAMKGKAKR